MKLKRVKAINTLILLTMGILLVAEINDITEGNYILFGVLLTLILLRRYYLKKVDTAELLFSMMFLLIYWVAILG